MSKNSYRCKAGVIAACCALCLSGQAAGQDERFPYEGEVNGDRVNVRAGSSLNYEEICKLNEGDRVAVRGEQGGWLKILPPPPVRVWIWGEYVRDGVVVKDAVNVRARPGNRSSILCQVDKGDTVRAVDQQGEWLGISPPSECYVWVSEKYVEYLAPLPPTKEDLSRQLFQKYEARRRVFDGEEDGARKEIDELIAGYREVMAGAPESKVARLAGKRAAEMERIGTKMDRALERERKAEEKAQEAPPPAVKKPSRRCIATGILRGTEEPVAGATYRLMRKWFFVEKTMCYLTAPGINLDSYVGRKVTVTGVVIDAPGKDRPAVEVRNIVLE